MRIRGLIHMIDLESKVIGIVKNKRIMFFYFQTSQMNLFKRYLYVDNWIDIEYKADKQVKKNSFLAYTISFVYTIEAIGKNHRIVYYDKNKMNNSLNSFLYSLDNMMFLDLEMTMPSYGFKGKGFKTELIQAGYVLVDHKLNEIKRYSNYVMPRLSKAITKRTEEFLHITEEEFEAKAIPYNEFYRAFASDIDEYSPAIIVFGRNDILVLNSSYEINNMPSIQKNCRFINLCQLIKTHYELKNDPGLFKLYKIYYGDVDDQVHDAFDDCEATLKVFEAFKNDVAGITHFYDIIKNELQ